jgi:hypothetical protein
MHRLPHLQHHLQQAQLPLLLLARQALRALLPRFPTFYSSACSEQDNIFPSLGRNLGCGAWFVFVNMSWDLYYGPCYTETDIYYTETANYYTETAKPIVVIRLCDSEIEDPSIELCCSLGLVLHNMQLLPQH